MKVAITGHTRGIGAEIHQYFSALGYECIGFSRANGYNIDHDVDRQRIIQESLDCDIFVNNACNRLSDTQLHMLQEIYEVWKDTNKIIINMGSRAGDYVNSTGNQHQQYSVIKHNQDKFCEAKSDKVWLINLRPGAIDTPFMKSFNFRKMDVSTVSTVLDFILTNRDSFRIKTITFGL